MTKYPVIFLDRDGVIIKDVDLLTSTAQVEFYPYTTLALQKLKRAGFKLVVVTNQPVVARGLISELKVVEIHDYINSRLLNEGLVTIDQYYFCPHHPQATLIPYRVDCQCRKPFPGLLLKAAQEMDLDLEKSYMIGDRISDIIAGFRAGCRTIQVETGQHKALPIQSSGMDVSVRPDYRCKNLQEASNIVMETAYYYDHI